MFVDERSQEAASLSASGGVVNFDVDLEAFLPTVGIFIVSRFVLYCVSRIVNEVSG